MNRKPEPQAVDIDSVYPTRVGMNRIGANGRCGRNDVYPTRVGMNRLHLCVLIARYSIPHASGDEPQPGGGCFPSSMSIPHASGDEPCPRRSLPGHVSVYPTRVGMNRRLTRFLWSAAGYTPREWG